MTIPLKYRPKIVEPNTSTIPNTFTIVDGRFDGDLNLGTFLSYTTGYVNFANRKYESYRPYTLSIAGGVFFGIGLVELNSTNTQMAEQPFSEDDVAVKIASVSIAPGVVFNVNRFKLGLFTGWDISAGELAERWDYNRKQWYGIGVGYIFKDIWP